MEVKVIQKKNYLILLFVVLLAALPISSVKAPCSRNIAIDVTRLHSYKPSFATATSALAAEGFTVDVWNAGEITSTRLNGYCVLIIVWPQRAYTDSEVTAILNFVSSGNGLIFLGDYGKNWDSLSDGYYPEGATPIIGPLGVSINNDVLYDPTDYEGIETGWPLIHTFPGVHPVTWGISTFMPAGTATLVVSSPARTIATGDDDTYIIDPPGPDPMGDAPLLVEGPGGSYEPVLAASVYNRGRAVVAGDHNWIADGWDLYNNIPLLINAINWLCPPCDGIPLFSDALWILPAAVLAGVLVIRRRRYE